MTLKLGIMISTGCRPVFRISPIMLSSLPSPTVSPLSCHSPTHLNSFVVLTPKSCTHRLARRRNSLTSSCSTASNSSDDELEASDNLYDDHCCIVYESYAAVTKRSSRPSASIHWKDLQLVHKSEQLVVLLTGRRLKPHPTALELCFEFLTLEEVLHAGQTCTAFYNVVTSSKTLLPGLYSHQWRTKMLPETYMTLAYSAQLTLCAARRAHATYELSTRSALTRLGNGNYHIVNSSMLRNFDKGAIDSIRGVGKLSVLSCARALHKRVSYYEVNLKGGGSVGLVSISDAAVRKAYGFGSGEHVGWKGVSYGYHGNDGDFVFNDGTKPYGGEWSAFGPSWGRATTRSGNQEKDELSTITVGCGLDVDTWQGFFTLNGKMIRAAPRTVLPGDYAVAVSLHAFGDEAVINTGAALFLFDIEAFCASP